MSRHRRLAANLRSPRRRARQWRNRLGRQVRAGVREHFADGHTHPVQGECPR